MALNFRVGLFPIYPGVLVIVGVLEDGTGVLEGSVVGVSVKVGGIGEAVFVEVGGTGDCV